MQARTCPTRCKKQLEIHWKREIHKRRGPLAGGSEWPLKSAGVRRESREEGKRGVDSRSGGLGIVKGK
jgi:hypothetical protein